MRALVKAVAPAATEKISYAIPAFDLSGTLIYFAGFKGHIGLYPMAAAIEAFAEDLKPYRSGKGSVRFPLGEPLPADLIRRIVAFRVEQVEKGSRP